MADSTTTTTIIDPIPTDQSMAAAELILSNLTSKTIEALTESINNRSTVLAQMEYYLSILAIDTNQLNIIHVAGTKGKGSTCAFIESIALEHGLTVGLYTSPHLISITERFRYNRTSITEQQY